MAFTMPLKFNTQITFQNDNSLKTNFSAFQDEFVMWSSDIKKLMDYWGSELERTLDV